MQEAPFPHSDVKEKAPLCHGLALAPGGYPGAMGMMAGGPMPPGGPVPPRGMPPNMMPPNMQMGGRGKGWGGPVPPGGRGGAWRGGRG